MADIIVATCGGGAAQLVLERDDLDLLVHAIRVDSTIRCELDVTMEAGQPITIVLGVGTRRVALPPGRRFVLDDTDTIPVPWALLSFRAIH